MKKLKLILFMILLALFGLVANHVVDLPAEVPASAGTSLPAEGREETASTQDSGRESQNSWLSWLTDGPAEKEEQDPAGPAQPSAEYADLLQLSELMPKNKAAVADASGRFFDWAELENISGKTVSLSGWSLTDRENQARWSFSQGELAPGERTVVFFDGESGPSFSLSQDETLYLLSPEGALRDLALCSSDRADCSLIRNADGSFTETPWISPGLENGTAGYEQWCLSQSAGQSLVINEACVYNRRFVAQGNWDACDWVEIKNISANPLALGGCSLSDKGSEARWTFPEGMSLAPGELLIVCCHNDEEEGSIGTALNTGFDLSAAGEQLYLRNASGELLDYAALHDIPLGCSMGRLEGQPGFFYFAERTPGSENGEGCRRVTDAPLTAEPDGVYNDVGSVTVTLLSPGEIHYTLDGSVPTLDSPVYTEPLQRSSTGVVRTLAREEGALSSPVATYSYVINENHTLPVMSLVVDSMEDFNNIWYNKIKHEDVSANLALYDGEHSFNRSCALSMKGYTSLDLPKKSMGVSFKGRYGGNLEANVFDNGVTEFSSLAIRGGQDYTFSIFRNELFQRLCEECGDACLTQASKYCILYVNGRYFGIYCLKEDFSDQYYASHAGVSAGSVVGNKCPVSLDSEFHNEVLSFIYHHDLSVEENYQYVCDHVNIDSLIDWFLLEGYCANTDIQGNTRMYRSPENGNKWQFCFYDLDWGFWYPRSDFTIIMNEIGNAGNQMPPLIKNLLKNRFFRDRVLERFAELNRTVLSNEHVLALIDEYQALLEPEIKRERDRWYLQADQWYVRVDELRSFIKNNNWEVHNIDQICYFLKVGELERQQLFGR